ncbi:hypothetical protein Ade02nite_84630 [Paractinoplanes deccanensis]|uniref:Uncharacterized protein n=1 Tax=Paractinoplanes deccanensis TaxID=113561 RepID=A0ABQ3YIL1_9ACTN|nr:hypothetical protein [Actinoplanes deccanensis]GID79822.1 hypothetical protein Ade02nite_84630 [Actinoplanes deccanensis]
MDAATPKSPGTDERRLGAEDEGAGGLHCADGDGALSKRDKEGGLGRHAVIIAYLGGLAPIITAIAAVVIAILSHR